MTEFMNELPVVYNRSLLSYADYRISDPIWYARFLTQTQYVYNKIVKIVRLEVAEEDVSRQMERLLSDVVAISEDHPMRYSANLQLLYNDKLRALEKERKVSKQRTQQRCTLFKEGIMMKAWHPDRVERLLLAGYDVEDM